MAKFNGGPSNKKPKMDPNNKLLANGNLRMGAGIGKGLSQCDDGFEEVHDDFDMKDDQELSQFCDRFDGHDQVMTTQPRSDVTMPSADVDYQKIGEAEMIRSKYEKVQKELEKERNERLRMAQEKEQLQMRMEENNKKHEEILAIKNNQIKHLQTDFDLIKNTKSFQVVESTADVMQERFNKAKSRKDRNSQFYGEDRCESRTSFKSVASSSKQCDEDVHSEVGYSQPLNSQFYIPPTPSSQLMERTRLQKQEAAKQMLEKEAKEIEEELNETKSLCSLTNHHCIYKNLKLSESELISCEEELKRFKIAESSQFKIPEVEIP